MNKRYERSGRIGLSQLNITRRDALKLGVYGSAGLLLPAGMAHYLAHAANTPTLEKFKDPLPVPEVLQPRPNGTFHVRMKQFKHEVHSDVGPITRMWGYGDRNISVPGPTFDVQTGSITRVKWKNRLARNPNARHFLDIDPSVLMVNGGIHGAEDNRKAVVHLHGGHISADVDGYPEDTFLPGENATYNYKIDQAATTLWYHDHSLGNTRLNVYMGLAGFFLVRDDFENNLIATRRLPSKEYEVPIVIMDRRINGKGGLSYPATFNDMFIGDVAVVNGKAWPHFDVEPRQYRFRLLNGSNTRSYTLQLGDGSLTFQQIGSDQGFLAAPVTLNRLTLTPGERADILINLAQPGLAMGDDIILRNLHPSHHGEDETPLPELMQFRVQFSNDADPVRLPAAFQPIVPLNEAAAVRERDFSFEDHFDSDVGDSEWLINERAWDDINEYVQNGDIEIWNWINKSEMTHPMHIHLVKFQVLGRYRIEEDSFGNLIPGEDLGLDEGEKGWKDTVRVGPKEYVRVIAEFSGQQARGSDPELYAYHCHILEHEDHEMMRQFQLNY